MDWDPTGIALESSRKPAPGSLRLIQSVVNSCDYAADLDEWATSDGLERWFRERRLLSSNAAVEDQDRALAFRVRESLRALLMANCGGQASIEAAATLNEAVDLAQVHARFRPDGSYSLEPEAGGIAGAVGQVIAIVLHAMADGSWARLKVCRNEACRWCFYDGSKNSSGRWCTAELCGNQLRARAYRARARSRRREEAGDGAAAASSQAALNQSDRPTG